MKKIFLISIGFILILALTGCEKNREGITVWGAQEDQEMIMEMVEDFKSANPNITVPISFGVVSEADTKGEVLKDIDVAADVFSFASDQIAELHAAGALFRITRNKDQIIAENTEASITASTINGELYAYPSSSDTYFLYYDGSLYTEDDVKTLAGILDKNLPASVTTKFGYDIDNGWYLVSFFFAAGATLFGPEGTDPNQVDFNGPKGLLAGQALIDLANDPGFKNMDDTLVKAGFRDRTLGSAVSGTWNAADIEEALGDDYRAAKLPTVTFSDGAVANLGSMANFKLYGVNAHTKHPDEAMALAEYLTSREAQLIRFQRRSFIPTNIDLAEDSAALSANPAVAAAAAQGQYATLQTSIPQMGNFWPPAEAFGKEIETGVITKINLQEKLDAFVAAIKATLENQ